jgi:hypothetical protein
MWGTVVFDSPPSTDGQRPTSRGKSQLHPVVTGRETVEAPRRASGATYQSGERTAFSAAPDWTRGNVEVSVWFRVHWGGELG